MKTFVTHQSALEYWRIRRTLPNDTASRRCRAALPNNPPATDLVKSFGLSLPIHIMLANHNSRWGSATMTQHIFAGETPVGCFTNTEQGFYVSSPEFCFLQMAGIMTFVELIELGFELCGTYSMPIKEDASVIKVGFYQRQALTNTKKLAKFLESLRGVKGSKKAKRALRYVLDGSASPMETKLSILLTLPYKSGGFGFVQPELNSRIIPSKTAKRSSSKKSYVCDLYWSDYDLAVEYDSEQFHTGFADIAKDSKKRNALTLMGVTVITVTKQQFYSAIEFEKVARVLANCLGKRLVFKNPSFSDAHHGLRNQLLGSFSRSAVASELAEPHLAFLDNFL